MIRHRPGLPTIYTDGDKPPAGAPKPPPPAVKQLLPVEDAMAAARARQEAFSPPAPPQPALPPENEEIMK